MKRLTAVAFTALVDAEGTQRSLADFRGREDEVAFEDKVRKVVAAPTTGDEPPPPKWGA